ncbi:glycerophosphodiester phosphodiesterase [Thermomonospora cellulosilytica]|uniref:Glycerophosphoryl diester phosphodiesterase n=1 Tax=Thermomonospora cellulosilytica TaxID=1411118 RepID=A0A7W3R8M9_9ACTN|nr:glycerophosphodiester phosphodiesterase family protein [Thermomonospora cellulosilytica]MBA9004498.1 glycerophosphoryl diester phosphodiesterase [Thermomonospora cellulosilytica]
MPALPALLVVAMSVAALLTVPGAGADPDPQSLAELPHRYVIAHRGAGAYLAPENTAAAFERGIADPAVHLLEFDVRTLKDGTGGVWHDATVDRISTSTGPVSSFTRAAFRRLTIDAGAWFGGGAADARPLLLTEVLDRYAHRKLLLADPKDARAAETVIAAVQARGLAHRVQMQSHSFADLAKARRAGMVTQLLIGTTEQAAAAPPDRLKEAGVPRVSLSSSLPDAVIARYVRAGLAVSCYKVNRHHRRDELYALGVRGIDTDDPGYIAGRGFTRATDPFGMRTWWYGHMGNGQTAAALGPQRRGTFTGPHWWTVPAGGDPLFARQGWAFPLGGAYTLTASVRFERLASDRTRWAGLYFSARHDHAFTDARDRLNGGYTLILRQNGALQLYRKDPAGTTLLKTVQTAPVRAGTVARLAVTVSADAIEFRRTDGRDAGAEVEDAAHRGPYLFLGRPGSGPQVSFSGVTVSRPGGRALPTPR